MKRNFRVRAQNSVGACCQQCLQRLSTCKSCEVLKYYYEKGEKTLELQSKEKSQPQMNCQYQSDLPKRPEEVNAECLSRIETLTIPADDIKFSPCISVIRTQLEICTKQSIEQQKRLDLSEKYIETLTQANTLQELNFKNMIELQKRTAESKELEQALHQANVQLELNSKHSNELQKRLEETEKTIETLSNKLENVKKIAAQGPFTFSELILELNSDNCK